jgi:hypothetical protein
LEPTFCQGAAMGLYNATAAYKAALGAYKNQLQALALAGVVLSTDAISFDGKKIFSETGIALLDLAAYNVYTTWTQCNWMGYNMWAGGCLNPGAQYGYTDYAGGGLAPGCYYAWMQISWGDKMSTAGGLTLDRAPAGVSLDRSPISVAPSKPSYDYWEGWVEICE